MQNCSMYYRKCDICHVTPDIFSIHRPRRVQSMLFLHSYSTTTKILLPYYANYLGCKINLVTLVKIAFSKVESLLDGHWCWKPRQLFCASIHLVKRRLFLTKPTGHVSSQWVVGHQSFHCKLSPGTKVLVL